MTTDPSTTPSVSRLTLGMGAASLFFLSFLMSGNANVLPQLFYQQFYADRKVLLLAVTLLVSTGASMAGVALSRRGRLGRGAVMAILLATTAAAAGLLSVRGAAGYIALISAVQFADNYLLNRIDHAAVARTGTDNRAFNDVVGNLARLLGMLAAPAFFTTVYGSQWLMTVPVAVLGLIACAGVAVLFRQQAGEASGKAEVRSRPLDGADRLLFGYAVSIYVAMYLFGANMIYVLRDHLQIAHAEVRGGRVIVGVFLAAAVANVAAGALRQRSSGTRFGALGLAAFVLFVSGAPLAAGVKPSFAVFFCFAAASGGSYGLFLLELRSYVSRGAREEGKTLLLTWFNNMANVSALVAFGLMVALALARERWPAGFYTWTLALIGGVPACGILLLLQVRHLRRRS